MKRLLLIITCLLAAAPAFAQSAGMQSPAYQECATLANSNPTQALAKADAWLKIDNGIASQHCHAMALYGLHRYGEAAEALNMVRNAISPQNISLRSYVTRQAARAYINASQADKAFSLFNAQIAEIGNTKGDNANAARLTADLMLDRARLNETYGKLGEAAKDLDHAVSLTPVNQEVLLERAGVFEKLGDVALAKSDLDAVLMINSANTQARTMRDRLNNVRSNVAIPDTVVAAPQLAAPANATDAANAAPVMAVVASPNANETSTLMAPTPLLNSSTTATPAQTVTVAAPAHKKRSKRVTASAAPKQAALLPVPDPQAP